MSGGNCISCLNTDGHIKIYSLPTLRPLLEVECGISLADYRFVIVLKCNKVLLNEVRQTFENKLVFSFLTQETFFLCFSISTRIRECVYFNELKTEVDFECHV